MQTLFPILALLPNIGLLAILWKLRTVQEVFQKKNSIMRFLTLTFSIPLLFSIYLLFQGPAQINLITWHGFGLSFGISSFNLLFAAVASIIHLIVIRFSLTYLRNEKDTTHFLRQLAYAGIGLQGFFLSSNVISTMLFLLLISYATVKLIGFYNQRSSTRLVSFKYRIVDNLATLFIGSALAIFAIIAKTGEISDMQRVLIQDHSLLKTCGIILLLVGSFIKAAQFPFHNWLTEVMEAPTPVSALLHAGIIGVGPFLIHIFSPLLLTESYSLVLIVIISIGSILLGAYSFTQQAAIKNLLAYSSIAHLGFTLLLFGLGLPAASLLHFSAHAFYKAHAFLSSGSELDRKNAKSFQVTTVKFKFLGAAALLLTPMILWLLVVYINESAWFHTDLGLTLFIGISVGTLFSNALASPQRLISLLLVFLLGCITLSAFVIFEHLFTSIPGEIKQPALLELMRNSVFAFFGLLIVYGQLKRLQLIKPLFPNLKIHFQHGLYIPILVNRLYANIFFKQNKINSNGIQ